MGKHHGLAGSMSSLHRLADAQTRSISAENFTGAKGGGGMATEGSGANCARELGQGWKISPCVSVPAHSKFTVAAIEGSGALQHIWMTPTGHWRYSILRIWWDDQEQPSVECPIGDFFACGWGQYAQVTSLPICVNPGSAFNCYWPMPFRKSAKITVTNDSDQECRSFYYYVDWQKHQSLPDTTAYFHAMYRQEYPCVMGQNYLLADIAGKGHYVGTIQSVYMMSPGWYGEGDDFFCIDGETEPSLRGTGTEDYFCDGWGLREQDGPFYGAPLWEGMKTGDRGTAYRWHLTDPIVFNQSLRAEIEHKGSQGFPDGKTSGCIERDDLMSSVAFWYQTEPHKRWPALPPGAARLPFAESTLLVASQSAKQAIHSKGPIDTPTQRKAVGNKYLLFTPSDDKAWIEFKFSADKAQTAELIASLVHRPDGGKYRVLLDGKDLGVVNTYGIEPLVVPHNLTSQPLSAGEHTLRFEGAGHSGASDGSALGLDALLARVPAYARPANFDLRTIQK